MGWPDQEVLNTVPGASTGERLVRSRELGDRIDRHAVVVGERQAVRTPRPAAGIVGQRLATTGTGGPQTVSKRRRRSPGWAEVACFKASRAVIE
jgi:hypothetical protein